MATMLRFDPFRELATWQNDVGRLVGTLRDQSGRADRWVPALDVIETESDIRLTFDLPGVAEEGISLELEEGSLTVSAERPRPEEAPDAAYTRFERRYGTFARSIVLPQGVGEDDITAELAAGVLEVTVRKPKAPQPRRIQIGARPTIDGTATDA